MLGVLGAAVTSSPVLRLQTLSSIKIMPAIDAPILRAYRMTADGTRIHYIVRKVDGGERHLYVDPGHPLYEVLDQHLLAQGYVLPASAG